MSTFSAGSLLLRVSASSVGLLHSLMALKVQLFVEISKTKLSEHSYDFSMSLPSSLGAHRLNREQLDSSAVQPSFSQVFSLGLASVVVVVASVVGLVGVGVGVVEARSVSEVDASDEVVVWSARPARVDSVEGSAELGCALFEAVDLVSRLSLGPVERPGSKPSSSLSGATEVGLESLGDALSWSLFFA